MNKAEYIKLEALPQCWQKDFCKKYQRIFLTVTHKLKSLRRSSNYKQKKMQAGMKKTFQVRVRSLVRTLKEYNNYKLEVEDYDLVEIANDKKKLEFYQESKSALDQVEKNLLEFYQVLNNYLTEHQIAIQQEPTVQDDYQKAITTINQVKELLPASC